MSDTMTTDVRTARPVAVRRGGSRRPILWILAAFPIACFTCALLTDIVYTQTAEMMWADFSAWLLAIGLAFGVIAAIVGIVELIAGRRYRRRASWAVVLGSVVALCIGLLDNLFHSRDAWTSVVPVGIALSAILVVVTWVTAWLATDGREELDVYSGVPR